MLIDDLDSAMITSLSSANTHPFYLAISLLTSASLFFLTMAEPSGEPVNPINPLKRSHDELELHQRQTWAWINDSTHTSSHEELRECIAIILRSHPEAIPTFAEVQRKQFQDRQNAVTRSELYGTVIDFDHFSKSCWKALNVTYSRMAPSKQYMHTQDVVDTIDEAITAIVERSEEAQRLETYKSALETCRKIGKSIILSDPGEIRKAVINSPVLESLAEAILDILNTVVMTDEDALEEGLMWVADNIKGYGSDAPWDEVIEKLEEMKQVRPKRRAT